MKNRYFFFFLNLCRFWFSENNFINPTENSKIICLEWFVIENFQFRIRKIIKITDFLWSGQILFCVFFLFFELWNQTPPKELSWIGFYREFTPVLQWSWIFEINVIVFEVKTKIWLAEHLLVRLYWFIKNQTLTFVFISTGFNKIYTRIKFK